MLAGFENGSQDGWTTFRSSSTSITPSVVSPGKIGNYAIKVDYSIAQGGWGGVAHDFSTPQSWTPYTTFRFWFYGNNTGNTKPRHNWCPIYLDVDWQKNVRAHA